MKSLADEAIVIGVRDYRETDRIVHLYTKEHGRLSGIARGAKKSVKRFGGAFELFARLSLELLPAENLATISSAEPLTIYPGIRQTFAAIAQASYAVELLTAITPERLPNKRVFRLLSAYLEQLDNSGVEPSDRHFFEMNLLNILGYRPPLESCSKCGAALAVDGGFWSQGAGHGLVCCRCAHGGYSLSGASIALLLNAFKVGRFGQIRFSPAEIAEVDRFMAAFIAAHISRPLKSLAFLRLSP
ncbi:MAG: DNA repair protein RecO [Deltaproteobacteria bacterium HGW-Deltaproteobacteria-23]|nr:MAG: DNA repair protein RecO [Deltaproteobacteria bacterium HGW-Deltaproteobacteria-23]